MTTIEVTETLRKFTCGICAGIYAIAERYAAKCEVDKTSWHCPYCQCNWGYVGKSEEQKQRERAERAESRARSIQCSLRTTERQLSATRGIVTRTKNRISKGVCPCCNRQFANLHRHMEKKHPEYASE